MNSADFTLVPILGINILLYRFPLRIVCQVVGNIRMNYCYIAPVLKRSGIVSFEGCHRSFYCCYVKVVIIGICCFSACKKISVCFAVAVLNIGARIIFSLITVSSVLPA